MSIDYLFVYGTLRRTAARSMHDLLPPATFIGPGTLRGRLYDLGDYPGAVSSADPDDLVRGEVYRLHDAPATLTRLDQYEGCTETDPSRTEYVRVVVGVALSTGDVVMAHVYLYQRPVDSLRRIDSGDFLARGQ